MLGVVVLWIVMAHDNTAGMHVTRHSGMDCRNPVARDGQAHSFAPLTILGTRFPPIHGGNHEGNTPSPSTQASLRPVVRDHRADPNADPGQGPPWVALGHHLAHPRQARCRRLHASQPVAADHDLP